MWRNLLSSCLLVCLLTSGVMAQDAVYKAKLNTVSLTVYGLAPIAVYERIIPFGEKFGMIASAGGFYYGDDNLGYSVGTSLYAGAEMHRGEIGAVYINEIFPIVYGTYRYTANSGLFARAGLGYAFIEDGDREGGIVPIIAIGYSF
ncbi:MAG: hypothetical protein JXR19_03490 [Bacteroidia bacterium]